MGVYYGVAALDPATAPSSDSSASGAILPAVLSIGYNPYYKNKARSIVRLSPLLVFSGTFEFVQLGRRFTLNAQIKLTSSSHRKSTSSLP